MSYYNMSYSTDT